MFNIIFHRIRDSYMLTQYRKIYPYVRPYWKQAVLALALTLPVGSMDAVIAWVLKPYLDVVMFEKNAGNFSYIPVLIVVFSVLQSMLSFGASYLNTWVGNKITIDLKSALFEKLMRNEPAFFDTRNSGDVLFRFCYDADASCGGLLDNLKLFTTRVFSSASLICVLVYNSWQLSIIAIVVMLGALVPMAKIRKRLKKVMDKSVFAGSAVMTLYNEAYGGNRVISSYNLYDYENARFGNTMRELFKLCMKITRRSEALSPIMHLIVSFGIAAVIWAGGYLAANAQLTPGGFVSFIAALIMLYHPFKSLGKNYAKVQLSFMAMERAFEMLERQPAIADKPDARPLEKITAAITYENVNFAYGNGRPVLTGVNLTIPVGKTYAFVGNSGGGKTTLVNLLPRFYDVISGAVRVDGVDVRDYAVDSLRDKIAIVFQDNFLFAGTIRENILLGQAGISEERLQSAIRNACLDEFIGTLEKGLDTEIGERGILLSGGQKQRVAIARAFIKDAPIVILDEATSALDNKSEAIVQQAIYNLMRDRTVLIIAHRLSTVRDADQIVVVNHGVIAEQGTHDELTARADSIYGSLYMSQLK